MFRNTLLVFLLFASFPVLAQHSHHRSNGPKEKGQSAFSAISEIVGLLLEDPETDWAKVDVGALQSHLVDMDLLTTRAKVTLETTEMKATFSVSGEGETVGAIQRMTIAHAPMLAKETGWAVEVKTTATGAVMQVQLGSQADLMQATGLGFFGIMTIGAHHQAHHLQIARGRDPHH